MSHLDVRTWTCDRCASRTTTGTTAQPDGWIAIAFVDPPLRSMEDAVRRHLCKDCEVDFADFLFRNRPSDRIKGVETA